MQKPLTTNDVRRLLENAGAERPGRRAVEMIASPVGEESGMTFWEMQLPLPVIEQAVSACVGLQGEDSYRAFRAACCRDNH